ncbi:diaminopimelate dehydrogenase [Dolosicoccus paucivorans]|uniref:Meso-diaminopimelate D-dehydrogenase n=1 Tax=Dolosicoccus paucivorans TaxID=84521 RepID=A0A1G8PBM4_9LACT|nr:diaminopimelate dehydrogenase [Dolosicoccus paucivorans]PMB83837.1 diaminopimelate dehydrogenase [Dolosicoccus paucivorans]PMC57966.1 diaminopimelate dehydrogenase [Dolosicoccus paucivorans]SDI89872.1 diaminopimelate dehydrogenase [Dolosicoccus paucivorans]
MSQINIGIIGYGNLGKGVEISLSQNSDFNLVGIFSRRDPKTLDTKNKAYHVDDLLDFKDQIDVLILCGGSKQDIPKFREFYSTHFSTVDCYDNHQDLWNHYQLLDDITKKHQNVAVIATGWDPGVFSLQKLYSESFLPEGETFTFYGPGLSQGHSDAVRQVEGVKLAAQYTLPNDELVSQIQQGLPVNYTKEKAHIRDVYVVTTGTRSESEIEESIVNMPDYFQGYQTHVYFIDEETFNKEHQQLNHGGYVLRRGMMNGHQSTYKLELNLDSNPEFTASVAVAAARAAYRLQQDKSYGAKSLFDIPPSYLSSLTTEEMIKKLL